MLVEYARLLALGAARAPDLQTRRRFAELAQAILAQEMELHRAFARKCGISEAKLEAAPPAPTTQATPTSSYARPSSPRRYYRACGAPQRSRSGLALGDVPADPRYARWIETYAADPAARRAAATPRAVLARSCALRFAHGTEISTGACSGSGDLGE